MRPITIASSSRDEPQCRNPTKSLRVELSKASTAFWKSSKMKRSSSVYIPEESWIRLCSWVVASTLIFQRNTHQNTAFCLSSKCFLLIKQLRWADEATCFFGSSHRFVNVRPQFCGSNHYFPFFVPLLFFYNTSVQRHSFVITYHIFFLLWHVHTNCLVHFLFKSLTPPHLIVYRDFIHCGLALQPTEPFLSCYKSVAVSLSLWELAPST